MIQYFLAVYFQLWWYFSIVGDYTGSTAFAILIPVQEAAGADLIEMLELENEGLVVEMLFLCGVELKMSSDPWPPRVIIWTRTDNVLVQKMAAVGWEFNLTAV